MQPQNSIPTQPHNTNVVKEPKKPKNEGLKSVLSTIFIIIAAPVLALIITSFVFQSYEVDGPSMETTLQNKDRLIVWKLGKSFSTLTRSDYVPQRGEVIVFMKRGLYGENGKEKSLIKRVIGLPGDRVTIDDGAVTIYNNDNPEGFNPDAGQSYSSNLIESETGNVDVLVKDAEVFVLGDNRPNSLDSRSFGTVPAEDITGTLTLRIFPFDKARSFKS